MLLRGAPTSLLKRSVAQHLLDDAEVIGNVLYE